MNKYQEAFKRIKNVVVFYINYNDYKNDLEYVQELVDKEIPMKPINQYPIDFGLGNYGECKRCNNGVNYQQNRCDDCGQVVDWSDDNE